MQQNLTDNYEYVQNRATQIILNDELRPKHKFLIWSVAIIGLSFAVGTYVFNLIWQNAQADIIRTTINKATHSATALHIKHHAKHMANQNNAPASEHMMRMMQAFDTK